MTSSQKTTDIHRDVFDEGAFELSLLPRVVDGVRAATCIRPRARQETRRAPAPSYGVFRVRTPAIPELRAPSCALRARATAGERFPYAPGSRMAIRALAWLAGLQDIYTISACLVPVNDA